MKNCTTCYKQHNDSTKLCDPCRLSFSEYRISLRRVALIKGRCAECDNDSPLTSYCEKCKKRQRGGTDLKNKKHKPNLAKLAIRITNALNDETASIREKAERDIKNLQEICKKRLDNLKKLC